MLLKATFGLELLHLKRPSCGYDIMIFKLREKIMETYVKQFHGYSHLCCHSSLQIN